MQRLTAFLQRLGPRDNWREGFGLISLGVAAYLLAGLHPYYPFSQWQLKLPLLCVAGLIVLSGAMALPSRSRGWQVLRLVVAAAAVHWAFILTLERYWYQF